MTALCRIGITSSANISPRCACREIEIVEELALHLATAYEDALAYGLSEHDW